MSLKNIIIITVLVLAYAYVSNQDYEDAQLAHDMMKAYQSQSK